MLYPIQLLDKDFICSKIKENNVKVLSIIDSTNQYLIKVLKELNSGDVCIAECQKAGRGRRGRKWFSPFGTNIYLSMYWCLNQKFVNIIGLSLVIGIAIFNVLQELGADQVKIKWPNDLYMHDRKLAGILVELINKTSGTTHLIIGVGINLTMHNIKKEIVSQNWIGLQEIGKNINRNTLAIQLVKNLHNFLIRFEQDGLMPFLSAWKYMDNFINRPVKLFIGSKCIYGISRGINTKGALLLEQDGIIKSWIDGEISLRSAI